VKLPTSPSSEAGFTLIEVMVSIIIMMIGLLGLLQAINVAMQHNLKNQLRDEAVRLADDRMNSLRARPFDQITSAAFPPESVPMKTRGVARSYTVSRSWSAIGASGVSKELAVKVSWTLKGEQFQQQIRTIKSR